MIIKCVKCGNDIIEETGWIQDENGNWICNECQKEEKL